MFVFFFVKQKTAYELRISDCSSDVCSADLAHEQLGARPEAVGADGEDRVLALLVLAQMRAQARQQHVHPERLDDVIVGARVETEDRIGIARRTGEHHRSEEHTSELQSLMRISYAVLRLKQIKTKPNDHQSLFMNYKR